MISKCCAAAPSPLGEGWPKAGVCRTVKQSICVLCRTVEQAKSGHSAPAVEKGAVICLFSGCFYALTFCISVNNSVFALFCACLCRFCVCRRVSRSFCGLFSGSVVTFLKFFSCFKLLQIRYCAALLCFRAKIFFGSLENGCIFALAFASGRGLLKKEAQGH